MNRPAILIVDDEPLIRMSVRGRLENAGYAVFEASTGAEAIESLEDRFDLVLLDQRLPDIEGLDLLRAIREIDGDLGIVLMTAYSSIESGVEAIKLGAFDYLIKPVSLDRVLSSVQQALASTEAQRAKRAEHAVRFAAFGFDQLAGNAPSMRATRHTLRKIARSRAMTVLITGESGTGKDLAAKAIHYNSERAEAPFMNITCSALPDSLLENELFGHERGAFTDAKQQQIGLLEMANGGSVFLDEIGELSLAMQPKLLRFLEERAFKRVGGHADIRVDVRIIAATNRELAEEVEAGRFRGDLYYRLCVLPVSMPPLHLRRGDVALLARRFVTSLSQSCRKNITGISESALQLLEAHRWPGNVRELRNAVERAVVLGKNEVLLPDDFQLESPADSTAGTFRLPPEGLDYEELERDLVMQALQRTEGNLTRAAALLGINRDQIRYRIEKYRLARTLAAREGNVDPDSSKALSTG